MNESRRRRGEIAPRCTPGVKAGRWREGEGEGGNGWVERVSKHVVISKLTTRFTSTLDSFLGSPKRNAGEQDARVSLVTGRRPSAPEDLSAIKHCL